MKERKHRVEDAVAATKAAVEEGVVPGGGIAFLFAQKSLNDLSLEGDEKTGLVIVRKILEEPTKVIAENAGKEGAVVVETIRSSEFGIGFNALTLVYEDMVKAGIVDPVKVSRFAIQNAASIAAMILTTEALVVDKPEKEKPANMPPMPEY